MLVLSPFILFCSACTRSTCRIAVASTRPMCSLALVPCMPHRRRVSTPGATPSVPVNRIAVASSRPMLLPPSPSATSPPRQHTRCYSAHDINIAFHEFHDFLYPPHASPLCATGGCQTWHSSSRTTHACMPLALLVPTRSAGTRAVTRFASPISGTGSCGIVLGSMRVSGQDAGFVPDLSGFRTGFRTAVSRYSLSRTEGQYTR
jgi:hypothetical protein